MPSAAISTGSSAALRRRGSVRGLSAAYLLPVVTGLITGPLAARALGPTGRGQAAAILAYTAVLPFVYQGGLNAALLYFRSREPTAAPALFGTALRWALATVPVSCGMAMLVLVGPLSSLPTSVRVVGFFVLGSTSLTTLTALCQPFVVIEGSLRTIANVQMVPVVLSAVAVVTLYITHGLTPVSYLLAAQAGTVLATIIMVRGTRIRPRGSYPLRPLLRFSLRSFPSQVAGLANLRLDQILIAPLIGAHDLGLYAVAVTIASLPLGIAQAVANRAQGAIAAVAGTDDFIAEASKYFRITGLVATICCLGLGAIVPVALPLLYGDAFSGSIMPLIVLLPGTVSLALLAITRTSLIQFGRPGVASLSELFALAVTVAMLVTLLPIMGIVAASVASTVAYTINLTIQVSVLRRAGLRISLPSRDDLLWIASRIAQGIPVLDARVRRWAQPTGFHQPPTGVGTGVENVS